MNKILITGGSGFIGTNLVEHYRNLGWDVMNIDIARPRNKEHASFWRNIDIRDTLRLTQECRSFSPDVILHMAARTDLGGKTLEDYSSNTDGVSALIEAASNSTCLAKVIFASSMLVCPLGYLPKSDQEYCPNTIYGQSKALGEDLIKNMTGNRFDWSIVRPTSIWGPWFDVPYRDFFSAVSKGRYVHPRGQRIHRSYGFALNATYQIQKLVESPLASQRVFYLADYKPIELQNWAKMISQHFSTPPPREAPLPILKGMAKCGDFLKGLGLRRIPITSSRLKNLLTDAVYDLAPLQEIAPQPPYSVETAVELTVNWMKNHLEE